MSRWPRAVSFFDSVHGADTKHSRIRPAILPAPARQIGVSLYKLQAGRKVIAERQRHKDGCAFSARLGGWNEETDRAGGDKDSSQRDEYAHNGELLLALALLLL